jgi:hypothetical protein
MTMPGFEELEKSDNCAYADDTMYVFEWPAQPLGTLYWTPCSKCGKNHMCGETCDKDDV